MFFYNFRIRISGLFFLIVDYFIFFFFVFLFKKLILNSNILKMMHVGKHWNIFIFLADLHLKMATKTAKNKLFILKV